MVQKEILDRYHIKDARNLKNFLGDIEVQLTITSPPYADLKNYEVANQIGFDQDYLQEYLPDLVNIFQQCYDITESKGSLWIILDTFYQNGILQPLPFDLLRALKENAEKEKIETWKLRDIIIWDKTKTLPWYAKGNLRNQFEYILFLIKSKDYVYKLDEIRDIKTLEKWWVQYPERYNPKGKSPSNIWNFTIPMQGWGRKFFHSCPFPLQLVERIISLSSNEEDIVLDPFAGSGSVLAQAHVMRRKFIGLDINPKFKENFYKDILPKTEQYWQEREVELKKIELEKKEHQEKLLKLRMVKYARVVRDAILKESPQLLEDTAIMVMNGSSPSNGVAAVKMYFIKRNTDNEYDFLKKIEMPIKLSDAHKFQIDGEFPIMTSDEFLDDESIKKYDEFYEYENSKTHKWKNKLSLAQLKEVLSKPFDYKKIYSTIENNINIPLSHQESKTKINYSLYDLK